MKTIVCVDCPLKLYEVSVTKARRRGWEVWTGGARCPTCRAKLEVAALWPSVKLTPPDVIVVKCTSCGGFFSATQEYTDGWRPGIHWKRSDKLPLPLCPGWDISTQPISRDELAKIRKLPGGTRRCEVIDGEQEPGSRVSGDLPEDPVEPAHIED